MIRLLENPWVASCFLAAFLGAWTWMIALTRFDLSYAYPFTSLTFVLILLLSAMLFREPLLLRIARKRLADVALFQADARRLPFSSEYDVAGAFDLLEHIPEDEQALAEIARSVGPGGGLIVTVPQHPALWSSIDDYARHCRRYTRAEMTGKLKRAGFRVVRCTSFVTFLMPIMALSRFRDRGSADPGAEFRIPAVINWCFARLLDAERWLVSLGVSWPVGGSLLVVARRDE